MKYYVVSDVHGFYTELEDSLRENGYFDDPAPHQLIMLGDALDRGEEGLSVVDFLLQEKAAGRLIFVRGNHEDLLLDLLDRYLYYKAQIMLGKPCHHIVNGTLATAFELSEAGVYGAIDDPVGFVRSVRRHPFVSELILFSVNYYETEHYVFVHGYIPCRRNGRRLEKNEDWRKASEEEWEEARWINGMQAEHDFNIRESGKTIVCGHVHASYGHSLYEKRGSVAGSDAIFTPYYGNGLIAIDACTAYSHRVNCLILED